MLLFLRETPKTSLWTGANPGDLESIRAAAADLGSKNIARVSIFKSRSARDDELIAAALMERYSSGRTFKFIRITQQDLESVGAKARCRWWRQSPVYIVGLWHREVDLSNGRAESLVRRLRARGPISVERIEAKAMTARVCVLRWWEHQIESSWLIEDSSPT